MSAFSHLEFTCAAPFPTCCYGLRCANVHNRGLSVRQSTRPAEVFMPRVLNKANVRRTRHRTVGRNRRFGCIVEYRSSPAERLSGGAAEQAQSALPLICPFAPG